MRIRKKYFVGQLALVSCSIVLLLWMYGGDSTEAVVERVLSDPGFIVNVKDRFQGISDTLTWQADKCASIVNNLRITANFTLNQILDRMKLSMVNGKLHAMDTLEHAFVSKGTNRKSPIDDETLQVIVIPHSHNDPGWKKTYMKYFDDQTTHILTNIVDKLNQYPDMTFIWVESCFLNTWWKNQTSVTRDKFRELVQSGRLEIVSGQWVAPDEASTHYFALLDQLIEGHYWVKTNLGVVPETSLNFDQFGYSTSIPYFMKKSGLKNILIKRIHRGVKQLLGEKQWMTFNWRQFWDPEGADDIFAQVDTYEWMSISDSCGPDRAVCRGLDFSVMPDLPIPGSSAASQPFRSDNFSSAKAQNLHDFVQKLIAQFRLKTANYKQNVMLLPHGGDFHYDKKDAWDRQYRNMKLFMDYVNEHKSEFNVHMKFGTFKDYFTELEKQTTKYSLNFPTISGDFFTYTESAEYWTGYFTTRQFDKRLGREVQESLRAAELFSSIVFNDAKSLNLPAEVQRKMLDKLVNARQDLGIFQHHDAITGTSQAHVAADYEIRLSAAFSSTQEVLSSALEYLLNDGNKNTTQLLSTLSRTGYNKLTSRTPVPVTSTGTRVSFLNSYTQSRREIVSLTVDNNDLIILDPKGKSISFDIIQKSELVFEVLFEVNFPPVSVLDYTVKQRSRDVKQDGGKPVNIVSSVPEDFVCENEHVNVTFSHKNGSPLRMCYKATDTCSGLELDWVYYVGPGGAYTMMSSGVEQPAATETPTVKFMKGQTICSVEADYKYFKSTVSLALTKSATGKGLRVNVYSDLTLVNHFNGDLSMRVKSDVNNSRTFYVDSNGFQIMGRKFRSSIPFDGNVYPMSSVAFIEDSKIRLVVHSAQPHGVVSRTSGKLDFMIDRIAPRPEMDMPEPVKDSKPTKTIFFIELQTMDENEKTATIETALLSSQSLYINDIIQHPVYKFYSSGSSSLPQSGHVFIKQELSCDTIIANIKNLADENLKFEGTSLTLYRRAVSCSQHVKEHYCPLIENSNLRPGGLIGRSRDDLKSTEMFLSLLMEKQTIFNDDKVLLKPMDLKTFRLH